MATEFWSPAQVIFGPFVFSFQFLVLFFHLSIDKTDNLSYLMKLCSKFEAKKKSFDSVLTKSENPRWRLSDVMWRHSGGMIVAID